MAKLSSFFLLLVLCFQCLAVSSVANDGNSLQKAGPFVVSELQSDSSVLIPRDPRLRLGRPPRPAPKPNTPPPPRPSPPPATPATPPPSPPPQATPPPPPPTQNKPEPSPPATQNTPPPPPPQTTRKTQNSPETPTSAPAVSSPTTPKTTAPASTTLSFVSSLATSPGSQTSSAPTSSPPSSSQSGSSVTGSGSQSVTSITSGTSSDITSSSITSSTITSSVSSSASSSSVSSSVSSSRTSTYVCAKNGNCGTACAATGRPQATKRPSTRPSRGTSRNRRSLDPLDFFLNNDELVSDTVNSLASEDLRNPGRSERDKNELLHRKSGTGSSAKVVEWLTQPTSRFVRGLFGCTSVAIVSERGMWLSHHWESPSFLAAKESDFKREVLDAIRNGDGVNMPSAFDLVQPGGILSPETNPQIFILTPRDPSSATGGLLFRDRVNSVRSLLTGAGAPFQGVDVEIQGYRKATTDAEQRRTAGSARAKVLIQYDNNQVDEGQQPPATQQAIWRVFLEDTDFEHRWDASAAQIGA